MEAMTPQTWNPRQLLAAGVTILLAALGASAAAAGDKYEVVKEERIDDARKPAQGKALIYFVRTQNMGGAIKVKLFADGELAGIVGRKTFIPLEVDPGKHEFIAVAENAGFLEAEVEAGRIYYVQVAIHMGALKARTHFEVAYEGTEAMDEFLKTKAKLRGIRTTDEGRQWVAEDHEKDLKKIEKYREKGEEFATLTPDQGYTEPLAG